MRNFILTFVLGALTLQFWSNLPQLRLMFALSILLFFLSFLAYFLYKKNNYFTNQNERFKALLQIIFGLILGLNWAVFNAHQTMSWSLPEKIEKQKVIVEGYIASLPKIEKDYLSFIFNLEKIADKKIKSKILLSWYNDFPCYPKFKTGDKWRLNVRLKRPYSTMNPGTFDFEAYLFQNKIRAKGYVVTDHENRVLESKWYKFKINRLRQYLEMRLKKTLSYSSTSNLIAALVVGDQSSITQEEWRILRRTGTIHFMVIAGLHVGFVASFIFFITSFIWRKIPFLILRFPAKSAAAFSAIFGAIFYSAMAGFSIPTQRATIMTGVFMAGILLRRNILSWQSFILGLFVVILLDPLASLNPGFWLSFGAVFLITYALNARLDNGNKFKRYNHIQFSLTIGLIPFTLLFFNQAPLISFFANMPTVPWVGFVVIPLSLFGTLFLLIFEPIGHIFLVIAEKCMVFLMYWLNWMAKLPFSSWNHYVFNRWILVAGICGMLILLAPRGLPRRFLGILLLLPLALHIPKRPNFSEAWFTLLDVGQGTAAVIQTRDHIVVYDTGPKSKNSNAGENVVLPFLSTIGAKKIDMLVVSHNDSDHSGGAKAIINSLPINLFFTSDPSFFLPIKADNCFTEMSIKFDGVEFNFLHPPKESLFAGNDASCVLRVKSGKNSILLTGDIQKQAEKFLIKKYGGTLHSNILIAPHHGSNTSSSQKFLNFVNPKYVLFATGYKNRFNFPSKNVVKRCDKNGAIILNTAYSGAITFKINAESSILTPEIYRQKNRKFWYSN